MVIVELALFTSVLGGWPDGRNMSGFWVENCCKAAALASIELGFLVKYNLISGSLGLLGSVFWFGL